MAAESSDSVYKIIFMDIGMVNHICGYDWRTMATFDERQLVNEGGIAEQFVGQHLIDISGGLDQPSLHYWLRGKKSSNADVDYVIGSAGLVLPVEVKSGTSGSLKSLQQFVYNKDINLAIRFDLNRSSLQQVGNTIRTALGNQKIRYTLLSLPLYGVQELERIVYENL